MSNRKYVALVTPPKEANPVSSSAAGGSESSDDESAAAAGRSGGGHRLSVHVPPPNSPAAGRAAAFAASGSLTPRGTHSVTGVLATIFTLTSLLILMIVALGNYFLGNSGLLAAARAAQLARERLAESGAIVVPVHISSTHSPTSQQNLVTQYF